MPTLQQIGYAHRRGLCRRRRQRRRLRRPDSGRRPAEVVGFWIFAACLPAGGSSGSMRRGGSCALRRRARDDIARSPTDRRGVGDMRKIGGNAACSARCRVFRPCVKGLGIILQPPRGFMAEHTHSGPVELGAPMDYAEHRAHLRGLRRADQDHDAGRIAILQALMLFGIANNGFWLGVLMILLMLVATAVGMSPRGRSRRWSAWSSSGSSSWR